MIKDILNAKEGKKAFQAGGTRWKWIHRGTQQELQVDGWVNELMLCLGLAVSVCLKPALQMDLCLSSEVPRCSSCTAQGTEWEPVTLC